MENERFKITNNILEMALFGGKLCYGYINNDEFSRSRALLTYLTEEIFKIHRFPGFDEFYRQRYTFKLREAFMALSSKDLKLAKEELKDLYDYTQKYLKLKYPGNSSLCLKRSLNYNEEEQVINQILDRKDIITFESNIILSFADKNWLGSYNSNILLTIEVPFEKILIHYEALQYPNAITGEAKENEVWVLNDDPFGRIQHPLSSFKYEDLKRNSYNSFLPPMGEDLWNFRTAFIKHSKLWSDSWVRKVIWFRRKMGKID